MSESRHERRQHFRGKPRPGRRLHIRYRIEGADWVEADTRNIGCGGAYITTATPAPPGSSLEIELEVPTCDRRLVLKGQVRWAQGGDSEDAGMGVQFRGVDIDVLLDLNDYFASLTGVELGS